MFNSSWLAIYLEIQASLRTSSLLEWLTFTNLLDNPHEIYDRSATTYYDVYVSHFPFLRCRFKGSYSVKQSFKNQRF